MYYCIDLDEAKREVMEYDGVALQEDLDAFGVKNALELSDYDRKVFDTFGKAADYLERFEHMWRDLDNAKICKSRELPAMLYKRRYIVQTLFGEKMHTFRSYRKKWMSGQLFNLHDQTYFLTVKLISITEKDGEYEYKFENC